MRTNGQHQQDTNKNADGTYARGPTCEFCRKPAGHNYMSDPETLALGQGLGLTLCERKRCIAKRDALPVAEREATYSKE